MVSLHLKNTKFTQYGVTKRCVKSSPFAFLFDNNCIKLYDMYIRVTETFNLTFRYLDELLDIDGIILTVRLINFTGQSFGKINPIPPIPKPL